MKFAVVEYTSKTGDIWRHTPERPNYLCDPQKELDPTSFGCYVSALAGEHIPMTALIKPTFLKRLRRKITGYWPAYDISYLKKFDVLMIVHQISNGHEVTALVQRIKTEIPTIKILGVPTQPYGIIKEYAQDHSEWLSDFAVFARTCDVFVTIVRSTVKKWEDLTGVNAVYLPQPYPVEFASRNAKLREQKEKIIFVAGVPARDNIPKGLEVARRLQEKFPEYIVHVVKIADTESDFNPTILRKVRHEVTAFQPWREHLKYLSNVSLVINTDYTETRGRVQADCAAVGTPSIGANSDGQVDFFPALPAKPEQSIDELVAQGSKLLSDATFYDSVVHNAHQRLMTYDYENSATRIQELISQL